MNKRYEHPHIPYKDPKVMAHLFGLGLDCTDGHKRITQADKFSILGGSENTHDKMKAKNLDRDVFNNPTIGLKHHQIKKMQKSSV